MTQRSVRNFDIENVAEPGVLGTILDLSVNFLTLMASLGQKEYAGENFETVKHFEEFPYKYLVAHDTNMMEWVKVPERLHNSMGYGVGMTIPTNSLILLDSNVLYPVVYLKQGSDVQYSNDHPPADNDDDNIFVIREQSLDMAVMQILKRTTEDPGTNPGRVQRLSESVKVRHTQLFSEFLRLPFNATHNLSLEEGYKMTAVIREAEAMHESGENGLREKYLNLDYYNYYDYTQPNGMNPNPGGNNGKLIVMMPYISARHDMLGQISFNDTTDPAIILTTT